MTFCVKEKFHFQAIALLVVISSGFSRNPSPSTPCTVTLDICVVCVVTHRQPEIRYTILAAVYMVAHVYMVGLRRIPSCSIVLVFDIHTCHPHIARQPKRLPKKDNSPVYLI